MATIYVARLSLLLLRQKSLNSCFHLICLSPKSPPIRHQQLTHPRQSELYRSVEQASADRGNSGIVALLDMWYR
jgi:hypothetical protein